MPWAKFFDLPPLKRRVNVIEMSEFLANRPSGPVIDHVLHLQSPKWGAGEEFKWDPSVVPVECDFGTYPGLIGIFRS